MPGFSKNFGEKLPKKMLALRNIVRIGGGRRLLQHFQHGEISRLNVNGLDTVPCTVKFLNVDR